MGQRVLYADLFLFRVLHNPSRRWLWLAPEWFCGQRVEEAVQETQSDRRRSAQGQQELSVLKFVTWFQLWLFNTLSFLLQVSKRMNHKWCYSTPFSMMVLFICGLRCDRLSDRLWAVEGTFVMCRYFLLSFLAKPLFPVTCNPYATQNIGTE